MAENEELGFVERSEIYTRYKSKQMIARIDELKESVQRCIDSEQHWRELAHRSREEIEAEIRDEHDAENKRLKDELRFSVASLSSELELSRYKTFCEKHAPCRLRTKADGGKMPYVIQYGTGIGVCTTVYCQVCGEHEDITDTDIW